MDNFYSHEYLPQGEHPSYRANSLSPRQMSASPSDHGEFLFTELTTIEGSCEIASNPFEDKEIKEDNHGKDLSIGADKRDQSNGQPLQPNKTPTGDIRTVQSRSIKNKTQQESPGHHHQHSSSGGPPHAMSNSVNASPAKGGASELTGQPETFKSQESVGVTITVSSETDIMTQESIKDTGLNSNQLVKNLQTNSKEEAKSGQSQESGQPNEINEEDRHHHIEQMSSDGSTKVFVPNEELEEKNSNKPENMEWVGYDYYCIHEIVVIAKHSIVTLLYVCTTLSLVAEPEGRVGINAGPVASPEWCIEASTLYMYPVYSLEYPQNSELLYLVVLCMVTNSMLILIIIASFPGSPIFSTFHSTLRSIHCNLIVLKT